MQLRNCGRLGVDDEKLDDRATEVIAQFTSSYLLACQVASARHIHGAKAPIPPPPKNTNLPKFICNVQPITMVLH